MAWWVWLIGALAMASAEALGGEFVLLMLGGGALLTTFAALGVSALWLQLVIFSVTSLGLVFGLRPHLKHRFLRQHHAPSGIEALIGRAANVISTVDAAGGQVKIGGEIWSAKAPEGHSSLPPGTPVTVVEIRGATAIVMWRP